MSFSGTIPNILKDTAWPVCGHFKQYLPSIIFQETFPREEF